MAEVIIPRKDRDSVMKELYDALKAKPCECEWAWGKDGYGVVKECRGHRAMARYEAVIEVST
jgi:hypothetical protein